jgi:hypothetical protein
VFPWQSSVIVTIEVSQLEHVRLMCQTNILLWCHWVPRFSSVVAQVNITLIVVDGVAGTRAEERRTATCKGWVRRLQFLKMNRFRSKECPLRNLQRKQIGFLESDGFEVGNEDVDLQRRRRYQGQTTANNRSTPLYMGIFTDKPYEAYSSGQEWFLPPTSRMATQILPVPARKAHTDVLQHRQAEAHP